MIRNLFILIAVFIRLWAVVFILFGLYWYVIAGLFTAGPTTLILSWIGLPALFVPVLSGLILWFLAKPIARVITSSLD